MDALDPRFAVFLDRDGTIIEDSGFICRPEDVHFLPGAVQGLQKLKQLGFALIVVSNQSGLARGIFTRQQMEAVQEAFCRMVRAAGVELDDYFCCPHHVEGSVAVYRKDCADRKGSPGMILRGAHRHGIALIGSWMIGDRDDDTRAGRGGGLRTIRINPQGQGGCRVDPDFCVESLLEAAALIEREIKKAKIQIENCSPQR